MESFLATGNKFGQSRTYGRLFSPMKPLPAVWEIWKMDCLQKKKVNTTMGPVLCTLRSSMLWLLSSSMRDAQLTVPPKFCDVKNLIVLREQLLPTFQEQFGDDLYHFQHLGGKSYHGPVASPKGLRHYPIRALIK